jgi:hypothetical protein
MAWLMVHRNKMVQRTNHDPVTKGWAKAQSMSNIARIGV